MNKSVPIVTALITSLCFLPAARAQAPAAEELAPSRQDPEKATPIVDAQGSAGSTSTTEANPGAAPSTPRRASQEQRTAALEPSVLPPRSAARPRLRDGFYLRLTNGSAGLLLTGDGPGRSASIAGGGWAQGFSIGGSVARGLVLAGTVQSATVEARFKGGPLRNATLNTDDGETPASRSALASFTELGLLVDWYPDPRAGFHAGASGGLGVISITNRADDSKLYGISPAGTFFGGYDWAIGRDWSIGLSLVASGAGPASIKQASGGSTGYKLTPLSLGVQASILYF